MSEEEGPNFEGEGSSGAKRHSSVQTFGTRKLQKKEDVFEHNAWDNVEWDEEQEKLAQEAVLKNSNTPMDPSLREKYEIEAAKFWDKFYGQHQNKFFKDRNWLPVEFPELFQVPAGEGGNKFRILEVGCGAGNTVFPILASSKDPRLFVHACDFSSTAVELVKGNPDYNPERTRAFVLDISSEELPEDIREGQLDIVVMIFVLSAINPDRFSSVLSKIYKSLKPGGLFLFRDYGRYDLAQVRFKDGHLISENFYVRGDGTRVYFFTQEEIKEMVEREGFRVEQNAVDRRLIVNRMRQLKMYRVWLQGKFRKPLEEGSSKQKAAEQ